MRCLPSESADVLSGTMRPHSGFLAVALANCPSRVRSAVDARDALTALRLAALASPDLIPSDARP